MCYPIFRQLYEKSYSMSINLSLFKSIFNLLEYVRYFVKDVIDNV